VAGKPIAITLTTPPSYLIERRKLAQKLKRKIRPDLFEAMAIAEVKDDDDAEVFVKDAVDLELNEEE
jgi:hypothetical protein